MGDRMSDKSYGVTLEKYASGGTYSRADKVTQFYENWAVTSALGTLLPRGPAFGMWPRPQP